MREIDAGRRPRAAGSRMQDAAHHFLVNLSMVLCVAAITTVLFQRLRQPVVLGYLLAGALISPHTPFPMSAHEGTIHALSELGVILLMFSLGLEFSLPKLFRQAYTAGLVALIQCTFMIWLGYLVGQALAWTPLESLYTGALIAISSTTIIVKAFEEQGVRGRLADIVFGILIAEDLIAIFLLAVLTTVSAGGAISASGLASTTGQLLAFLAVVVGGGLFLVPRLVRAVVRLGRPETTVVSCVGICFALALLADAVGYSVALGAFLAGALVAESGEGGVVERLVQPVRDIFAAIFFVAVGMLLDPALVLEHWPAVVALTVVVVLGKLIGVAVGVFLTGEGIRTSVKAGMSLAQIGEFSFIIAGVGLATGATRSFVYPVAVSVSAVTTLLTPWLIRASGPVAGFVESRLPRPMATLAALYGTWIEELRKGPRERTVAMRVRQLVWWLVVDAALVAALAIATAVGGPRLAALVASRTGIDAGLTWLVVIATAVVMAVPFAVGIARCTGALARMLGAVALPRPQARADFADAPRRALEVTLEVAILLAIGLPLMALTQPFLPGFPGAGLLLGLLLVLLAVGLWRRARNLQEHARAGAQAIVEVLSQQLRTASAADAAGEDLRALARMLPGLGEPVPLRVHPGDYAVGRTLADLNLRGLSGATVLAVVRVGKGTVIPTGRESLQAGDVLAVAGTAEAIRVARDVVLRGGDDAGDAG
jgi:CPA2 family monovalent cation:H+ antiporter-2